MKRAFAGAPPGMNDEKMRFAIERKLYRIWAVGAVTRGHPKCVEARTLKEQVKLLRTEHKDALVLASTRSRIEKADSPEERREAELEIKIIKYCRRPPSVQTLHSCSKVYMTGGPDALMDRRRGGKGTSRGPIKDAAA